MERFHVFFFSTLSSVSANGKFNWPLGSGLFFQRSAQVPDPADRAT